jgi:hypothetical protein
VLLVQPCRSTIRQHPLRGHAVLSDRARPLPRCIDTDHAESSETCRSIFVGSCRRKQIMAPFLPSVSSTCSVSISRPLRQSFHCPLRDQCDKTW